MTRDARYDSIADFYVSSVGDALDDPVSQSLLDLLPTIGGLSVLDLACGHGRLTRELARRGARVVGLDISARLLERARDAASAEGLDIRWVEGDASSLSQLAAEEFDGVVSHFGMSDIGDLEAALATISRVLRPGGWFTFSILHPCFPGWGDDAPSSWRPGSGYFSEGWWLAENSGFRGRVGANHRLLSTYINALVDRGLRIDRMAEPRPSGPWLLNNPSGDLVPTYLVVRCTKP